jgi:hypothetical protein
LPLYKETVSQLASLARQNPPEALYENAPEVQESADEMRVAVTIDAILSDHIPIFGAYMPEHNLYGPFDRIHATVTRLVEGCHGGTLGGPPVHLWIPDYWSRVRTSGALYIDALAGRFSMKSAVRLLQVSERGRTLRSGTRIEMLSRGDHWSVKLTTRGQQSAILGRLTMKRQSLRIPAELHRMLFGDGAERRALYGWPTHLGDGFFLRESSQ